MVKKKSFFSKIMDFAIGLGGETLANTLQEKIEETMDEAEERVNQIVKKVLSALALFIIVFTGFIFVLVGLSKYLSETVPTLSFGLGFVIIGACLIIAAMLFKLLSK